MNDRRTPTRRPAGPGVRPGDRGRSRSGAGRGRSATRSADTAAGADARRQRPTGRAVVLLVVLGVLAVSWASSMRAHLEQQRHLAELRAQIAESEDAIAELRRERRRWRDDQYVEQMARQRLGFVMPGETSYQVIGRDGEPLAPEATLTEPVEVAERPPAWWQKAWGTVENAGTPREAEPDPAEEIRAPRTKKNDE